MEFINFPLVLVTACFLGTLISGIHYFFFRNKDSVVVENVNSFLPVLWMVLILRSFIVEPFQIPSGSMIPTLKIGDFILVNKFAYGIRLPVIRTKVFDVSDPERGDVMVFFPPHDKRYFIKRVVGIPGDVIKYENKQLTVNGELLNYSDIQSDANSSLKNEQLGEIDHKIRVENHNSSDRLPLAEKLKTGFTVRPGHYFMMGDNRDRSSDSRVWGDVSEDNIVGKAFFVWMHWQPKNGWPNFSTARSVH